MLILDTVGDTIQAEASASSSITITCYGIEDDGSDKSYVKLGQSQLTGSGTQDTIYTVPADSTAMCVMVVIANITTESRYVSLWHVPNGDSAGDSNAILSDVSIPANSTLVWNKGNIQQFPSTAAVKNVLLYFTPQCAEHPVSDWATLDLRNYHPVLDFDDTAIESAMFSGIMPTGYKGDGVTVYIHYAMTSATSGTIDWDAAFERIGDQQLDIDSDSFADANSVDDTTVPGTAGLVDVVTISFEDGADMDSVAAGEAFRLKITRDAVSDDAAGDAELLCVEIRES